MTPNSPGRQPPSFVPTLTRVLEEAPEVASAPAAPAASAAVAFSPRTAPAAPAHLSVLPVLQEVVDEAPQVAAAPMAPSHVPQPAQPLPAAAPATAPWAELEGRRAAEQIHARLLQRLDVTLQRRVRETAARIALEYAQDLLQELRPAIEKAVLDAVNEALEMELHSRR